MKPHRIITAFLLLAGSIFLLSGCSGVAIDELYSLPQPSDKYIQLQKLIDEEIASGSEYSAPTAGNYRQSVQLYDFDGDGSEEALAFFRDSKKALKICVYTMRDGAYALAAVIDGEGTAIGKIEYADLDGDSSAELIVAWQVSTGLRMLKVYSLKGFNSSVLLTADCTEFLISDMNADGQSELLILHFDSAEGGSVERFDLTGGEPDISGAKLSKGLESIDRVRTGNLSDGTPALFVEGLYDEGGSLLTDVFILSGDALQNLTLDKESGISGATVRNYKVYSTDIDSDRAMEIPAATPLHSQAGSTSTYWLFDWYSYDKDGNRSLDLSTYHCYNDGWYLVLPEDWCENLTIRREAGVAGERIVVLSKVDPDSGAVEDFLMVFTLTGENRWEKAKTDSRFVLLEESSTIYAASLLGDSVDREILAGRFKLIYTEWITGAL